MEAIIRLRRAALEAGLTSTEGARHITGFVDLVRRQGRLNEALMPLKIVGLRLARALHILPLGLAMVRRGKVPNPFGHGIPGMTHVRRIFSSTGRATGRS